MTYLKKINIQYLTLLIVSIALLTLIGSIILSAMTHEFGINPLLIISIILVIIAIPAILLIIIQAVQDKRQNQPETSNGTPASRNISTRFVLREGPPVTIEVPDAESAIEVLQAVLYSDDSLKVETGLTIEVKKPEERQTATGIAAASQTIPNRFGRFGGSVQGTGQLSERQKLAIIEALMHQSPNEIIEALMHQSETSDVPETKEPEK